ncbi:MAG: hypothetical protein LBC45_04425 [Chlamydiales bacterium]|jgi:hypothetical protein|nr:hypothetical protein [Chlamydiales bacterium]
MNPHSFLFDAGIWLGQGTIQLNMVAKELAFFTRWNIENKDRSNKIVCEQEIQIKGFTDMMRNQFCISSMEHGEFLIDLENQAVGKIQGKGLINDKIIAWEFRINEIGFEGFEVYEKQEDWSYLLRAEYATEDQFRTLIQGCIWKKVD